MAYVCDGKKIEAWLEGTLAGDSLTLSGKTSSITAHRGRQGRRSASVTVDGKEWPFSAKGVRRPPGSTRAAATWHGVATRVGWIVEDNGNVTGRAARRRQPGARRRRSTRPTPARPRSTASRHRDRGRRRLDGGAAMTSWSDTHTRATPPSECGTRASRQPAPARTRRCARSSSPSASARSSRSASASTAACTSRRSSRSTSPASPAGSPRRPGWRPARSCSPSCSSVSALIMYGRIPVRAPSWIGGAAPLVRAGGGAAHRAGRGALPVRARLPGRRAAGAGALAVRLLLLRCVRREDAGPARATPRSGRCRCSAAPCSPPSPPCG